MMQTENDTEMYLKNESIDNGEFFYKQRELYLCILGQERPLISGKRKHHQNVILRDYCEIGSFETCWDMHLTMYSILENEWGYTKIKYGEKYNESSK